MQPSIVSLPPPIITFFFIQVLLTLHSISEQYQHRLWDISRFRFFAQRVVRVRSQHYGFILTWLLISLGREVFNSKFNSKLTKIS